VRKLVVVNIAGLSWDLARHDAMPTTANFPGARPMRPLLPAVTCTMQATLTTGAAPAGHGIIANGLFDRDFQAVRFWEQSARLVQTPRIWQTARERKPDFTCAMLFWQNSVGADADIVLTPAPVHKADGGMVSSCYSRPTGLYDELEAKLGPFDLMSYWGPMASVKSSRWIASAAKEVFDLFAPDLTLVYLPNLDYPVQKLGPSAPELREHLEQTDALVAEISAWARAGGAEVVLLSEYGMTPVSGAIFPNRILRQAGLLEVREVAGMEFLDIAASKAFAMVDHQVAHIFTKPDATPAARAALEGVDGVGAILDSSGKKAAGLDHPRSGDLVALSAADRWFAYYWWEDAGRAPDFARTVDIHRKPGYDPCEMFIDIATRSISLDTSLVRASHGLVPERLGSMAYFACEAAGRGGAISAADAALEVQKLLTD